MKNLISLFVLTVLVISFVSADVIAPGQKNIPIKNVITNIGDFPDYTFVRICVFKAENQSINEIVSYEIINTSGIIEPYYNKPCNENSVYAFKDIDLSLLTDKNELIKNINLGKGIKVIEGIETIEYSTITDSRELILKEYTVSLNAVAKNPSNTKTDRSFLIYLYFLIPVLALLIVVYILIKRTKKE